MRAFVIGALVGLLTLAFFYAIGLSGPEWRAVRIITAVLSGLLTRTMLAERR